eukprot:751461-Pyramimonas_sp.AAC.1
MFYEDSDVGRSGLGRRILDGQCIAGPSGSEIARPHPPAWAGRTPNALDVRGCLHGYPHVLQGRPGQHCTFECVALFVGTATTSQIWTFHSIGSSVSGAGH